MLGFDYSIFACGNIHRNEVNRSKLFSFTILPTGQQPVQVSPPDLGVVHPQRISLCPGLDSCRESRELSLPRSETELPLFSRGWMSNRTNIEDWPVAWIIFVWCLAVILYDAYRYAIFFCVLASCETM